jgi:phosphatidylserine synthase
MVSEQRRRLTPAHLVAVAASSATTVLYALVGFEVVKVKGVAEVEPGPAVPLVMAAVVFAVLTTVLSLRPSRPVFFTGILLSIIVIAGYVAVAPSRTPSFEPWGLAIKAVQVVLLAALVLLVRHSRPAPRERAEPGAGRRQRVGSHG